MPFDFTAPVSALALYQAALASDAPDWRAVADAFFAEAPKPRKARAKAADDRGEWADYADNKGAANAFHGDRTALFTFADGQEIRVQLSHKKNKAAPDWARAARCAVSFYKARRARQMLKAIDGDDARYGATRLDMIELYCAMCAVPDVVAAVDQARGVSCDIGAANDHTAQARAGEAYMGRLAAPMDAAGGDVAAAWQSIRAFAPFAAVGEQLARDMGW
jgi:hypothetical protein